MRDIWAHLIPTHPWPQVILPPYVLIIHHFSIPFVMGHHDPIHLPCFGKHFNPRPEHLNQRLHYPFVTGLSMLAWLSDRTYDHCLHRNRHTIHCNAVHCPFEPCTFIIHNRPSLDQLTQSTVSTWPWSVPSNGSTVLPGLLGKKTMQGMEVPWTGFTVVNLVSFENCSIQSCTNAFPPSVLFFGFEQVS